MTRQEVEELNDERIYRIQLFENAKKQLELSNRQLEDTQIMYRIAEVDYVLDKVRHLIQQDKLSKAQIDTYLCHCLNCLHGNIDGTILDLEEEV